MATSFLSLKIASAPSARPCLYSNSEAGPKAHLFRCYALSKNLLQDLLHNRVSASAAAHDGFYAPRGSRLSLTKDWLKTSFQLPNTVRAGRLSHAQFVGTILT